MNPSWCRWSRSRSKPVLLRRRLALRQFPIFATAELAELAMVAENVVDGIAIERR